MWNFTLGYKHNKTRINNKKLNVFVDNNYSKKIVTITIFVKRIMLI